MSEAAIDTLEPGLTAQDKRILRAVPNGAESPACGVEQIAKAANKGRSQWTGAIEKREVADTLRGLEHLGYVVYAKGVYWQTSKGAAESA